MKVRINEELSHRAYSPLLLFILIAIFVEHYEIGLYLLDSSLGSEEKILKINAYWRESGSLYKPLLTGASVFLLWCVIHPVSALIWDLIKRLIIWFRKTKIHKIPVIPEAEYEAMEDGYKEERKRLNLEHSDMSVKVESIKVQLEQRNQEVQRKREEIERIKEQFSKEKERIISAHKNELSKSEQSYNREIKNYKNVASRAENEMHSKENAEEQAKRELFEFKLSVFDKENWKKDSASFGGVGFRWRFSFGYLSPSAEKLISNSFGLENVQFQKHSNKDFTFVWIKGSNDLAENPVQKMQQLGVEFFSVKDLKNERI